MTPLSLLQIATYEHVVVVMSILLGLAVTQLIKGIAQLYRARLRVQTYWIHSVWIALLIVLSLVGWWTYWNYRSIAEWNFLRFVVYLSPMIAFYYLTVMVIPDPVDAVASLREYYFSTRVSFFSTFALYGFLAGLTAVVVRGLPVSDPSNLFRAALLLLALVAMRSASPRVHAVVLTLSAILMVLFIVVIQFRLGPLTATP
jgi:hypothetical protein